jgi:hypothetical protein
MRSLIRILGLVATLSLLSACYNDPESNTDSNSTSSHNTSERVDLSWAPPSTRADGSYLPLSELAGYRVYMGTSSNNLTPLVDLNDDTITHYSVTGLSAGNYYFAVSAYDSSGLESGYSQIILVRLG